MTVTEISGRTYSLDDVTEGEGGYEISVALPKSGEAFLIKGQNAELLVDKANDMVGSEMAQHAALAPYGVAVETLLNLALGGDSSGAAAAAQVLLAAYNGNFFHLNVVDLSSLDADNYRHAMDVIEGRVIGMREPHSVVQDGEERFRLLWEEWSGFHAKQRYSRFYE